MRKLAHWKRIISSFECSSCRCTSEVNTPYCPWCGAKMIGKETEKAIVESYEHPELLMKFGSVDELIKKLSKEDENV